MRSYVFVSEIAEVTQAFSTYPVDTAIDWALKSSSVDYHCRSDFGYAFNRFVKTELETLDRKTTVLILGDARNNYNDPQAWAIRQIRERVKGVIWLNPEGQWGWGIGDSVMPLYSPACDIVKECRTVGQLVAGRRSSGSLLVASRALIGLLLLASSLGVAPGRRAPPRSVSPSTISPRAGSASFPSSGSRARNPAGRCTRSGRRAGGGSSARSPAASASRRAVR